ncbi:MAG: hypothetical protein QOD00_3547, partial [Blastocatellia bacterium]|nr:hypothetical protein [Blastocatellia bacterium]
MKKTLSILLLLLLASTATSLLAAHETARAVQQTQTAASPLTNKDVQEMVK